MTDEQWTAIKTEVESRLAVSDHWEITALKFAKAFKLDGNFGDELKARALLGGVAFEIEQTWLMPSLGNRPSVLIFRPNP